MLEKGLVTICITTFNRDFLIVDAVEKAFLQTYSSIEVIVVDDCSSDNTKGIIETLEPSLKARGLRFNYIRHTENRGLSAARNTAIQFANGQYFTFIDDDDSWDSSFVSEFVKLANNYDELWCFCGGSRIIEDKRVIDVIPDMEGLLSDYLAMGYTPPVGCQFYFTDTVRSVGGYRSDIFTCVDHDLWFSLAYKGIKIKGLSKPVAFPNTDVTLERMTTNPEKRLSKLSDTLEKWKADIISNFGFEFYSTFKNAYFKREKVGFLYKILLREGAGKALSFLSANKDVFNAQSVLKVLLKYLLKVSRFSSLVRSHTVRAYSPVLILSNSLSNTTLNE